MDRVFSEKEVSEIVQRAALLQEQEHVGYTPGVTREELVKIARELGVEATVLDRAISEQEARHRKHPLSFSREEERVVDGEVPPEDFDLVLNGIKPLRDRQERNSTIQIGKTLRTRAFAGGSIQKVEITSRKGRTQIKVKHFPFFPIFLTLYPAFFATVLSTVFLSIKGGMPLLALMVCTLLFAVAITTMRWWLAKGNRGTTELADKLRDSIAKEFVKPTGGLVGSPPVAEGETTEQSAQS